MIKVKMNGLKPSRTTDSMNCVETETENALFNML